MNSPLVPAGLIALSLAVLPGCSWNSSSGGFGPPQVDRSKYERLKEVRQAVKAPLDPDIVKVYTYSSNNPFMSFDEAGDRNPEGMKIAYYAVSARPPNKGAYADGLIRIKMYAVEEQEDGPPQGRLVKVWEYTPDEAWGWRSAKESVMGWGYQFFLNWGDADVYGKEIRLVPEFVRLDGKLVRGSPRSFKVPPRRQEIILTDTPAE